MNTPTAIVAIVVAAIASAGITWLATKNTDTQSTVDSVVPKPPEMASDYVPTPRVDGPPRREGDTPWSGEESTVAKEDREQSNKPADIDEESWNRAERRVEMMSNFAEMARESGFIENRMKERVTRDATRINQQLGLEGENAKVVEELLTLRMDASTSRSREMFDAMLSNKEGLTELMAMGEMETEETPLTPAQEARKSELKKSMFGQFYENGEEMSDDELRSLFRPSRPGDWYDDEEFVAAAAAELGEKDGAALQDYAEKMDYLDREERAYRRINNIERAVRLEPEQQQNLMQLYIENPDPSDEELGAFLSAEQIEQVKESNNNQRGWWGRGGRGGRGR